MGDKIKILICSEPPYVSTGYGKVISALFSEMENTQVYIMGWQFHGEPLSIGQKPGGKNEKGELIFNPDFVLIDPGLESMRSDNFPGNMELWMKRIKPDIVFSLIDIWFTAKMSAVCRIEGVPHLNYFPIDSEPIPFNWLSLINQSSHPCCMSKFALKSIMEGARKYLKKKEWSKFKNIPYIHHGVDTDIYKYDKKKKEEDHNVLKMLLKENGIDVDKMKDELYFVHFGNRNVSRKNLPAALEAFARFAKDKPNVFGVAKWGMWRDTYNGHDLPQLLTQLGLEKKIIKLDEEENPLSGVSEAVIAGSLSGCDVYLTASMGEGFGLWPLQAMACGTPPIATRNTTAPELIGENEERGLLVDCPTWIRSEFNTKFMVADIDEIHKKLEWAYTHPDEMHKKAIAGVEFAKTKDWKIIRKQFSDLIYKVIEEGVEKPKVPFPKDVSSQQPM